MDQVLNSLKRALPCRSSQIEKLYNLFAYQDEPYAERVYIHGGPSTGKSIVLTSALKELEVDHAVVNLVECYTSKILYETILNKLSGHQLDIENPMPYARCDNMMDFMFHFKTAFEMRGLDRFVLVLDKAEELRNMDFNLLPIFLRLGEFTGLSVTVVLISEIVFEKYYSKTNFTEPIKIYFPQYSKNELLTILVLDIDNARKLVLDSFGDSVIFDLEFYRNYLNAFLSVFYRASRDLLELRHQSRKHFPKYCQPIVSKQYTSSDSMALWRNIAPALKNSLEVLYLRVNLSSDNSEKGASSTNPNQNVYQSFELPYYAKYLLIAAYLASYNSAKDDKRLFMKYHGKKTKTKQDIKKKSKVSEQLNTQLGPKPFTFDRLLAIFYSILDEKVGFNNNLLVQLSSLVELRLLSTASDNCCLDGQKYKCNVNYDFIHGISRMLGFNIRKYLTDFSHV